MMFKLVFLINIITGTDKLFFQVKISAWPLFNTYEKRDIDDIPSNFEANDAGLQTCIEPCVVKIDHDACVEDCYYSLFAFSM